MVQYRAIFTMADQ